GGLGISRRAAELGVEGRQEVLAHVAIGGGKRRDAGHSKLVDEAILQGPVDPFAAAARLGRVAEDVLDAQAGQRPADLSEAAAIRGAANARDPYTGPSAAHSARESRAGPS